MQSSNPGTLNVRTRTQQVVAHHYDDAKPGKPLYLMIPGGLIALASLVLIIFIGYLTWIAGDLSSTVGTLLIVALAPFYIGGVFLFSYGYELYDVPKALRLTAIIVFITFAAVFIVAALAVALGAMGNKESRSSRSSSSGGGSLGRSYGGTGFGMGPVFLGGLGAPTQTVTREVIREVPTQPPPPQPIQCPYCSRSYVPAETKFICPSCGAPTPEDLATPQPGSD